MVICPHNTQLTICLSNNIVQDKSFLTYHISPIILYLFAANVIPWQVVFFDTANNRFLRPCDVPGFEELSVNCSKDSYPANEKVIYVFQNFFME